MTFCTTIKSLYALNGVVAVLLYLPQVVKAWRDREHACSLSRLTFGGWCIGSLISAVYAWLLVKDRIFTAVSLGNVAGSAAVFAIVAWNKSISGRERSGRRCGSR